MTSRHYLVVDDNRAFAENLADILHDDGAEVTLAATPSDALLLARGRRFDALVSDMKMPVMGGAELVHRVRELDPGLPAIVVTAYTSDIDLEAARQEGLLAALPKPVPIERLLKLLAAAKRGGLVALVEDDRALADNLSEALRERGYSTVAATSVLEAEELASVRPFVAVVDLRLPGGPDGEAMARLAARFPALPMLVVTGYPALSPPARALGFFPKPFSTQVLIDAIEGQYRRQGSP
jgi:two-component system, response regulator PdtaR